jgi:hypothetical protein
LDGVEVLECLGTGDGLWARELTHAVDVHQVDVEVQEEEAGRLLQRSCGEDEGLAVVQSKAGLDLVEH